MSRNLESVPHAVRLKRGEPRPPQIVAHAPESEERFYILFSRDNKRFQGLLKSVLRVPTGKRRSSEQLDLPSQHVPAFAVKA